MRPVIRRLLLVGGAALATAGAGAATAAAQPAIGVLDGPGSVLAAFDTDTPSVTTSLRQIVGIQPGEQIEATDYRDNPAVGSAAGAAGLYGLGIVHGATDTARLYRIDVGTGTAAQVGGAIANLPASSSWDVDFDAVSDQLRVVNDAELNMRIVPGTGTASFDADLNPSGRAVGAIAYDEEDAPQRFTTLHALSRNDESGMIGGWRGAPSANGGALSLSGRFGVTSKPGSRLGFDYSPFSAGDPWDQQTGYVTLTTTSSSAELYRLQVNMVTGESLAFVGDLAAPLRAFAVLPAPTVQFATSSLSTAEQDRATVTVTRSGPAADTATVAYAMADGTARNGDDYSAASGTLTFAPGETSKTFDVLLIPDQLPEADETVELSLRSPSAPLTLGTPATATLTIRDDDDGIAAPRIALRGVPASIGLGALLRRGVAVTVTSSKPVGFLEVSLVGTTRKAQISQRGNLVLASAFRGPRSAAARTFMLKPPRRLVGHPTKGLRLRVKVVGLDAAGQRAEASKLLRVRVPRRR